jgi:hypothetical protein
MQRYLKSGVVFFFTKSIHAVALMWTHGYIGNVTDRFDC